LRPSGFGRYQGPLLGKDPAAGAAGPPIDERAL
jgi:hypothetical protein